MRETFYLTGYTFSINAMYGPKKFKTSAAKTWEYGILHQLNGANNSAKFEKLRNAFDVNKHGFSVTIIVEYPVSEFYTKNGTISAHTQDVSNVEKPLIDLFFLPKYFSQPDPYGAPNLNIDDKYIVRMQSIKRVGPKPSIRVSIGIINCPR